MRTNRRRIAGFAFAASLLLAGAGSALAQSTVVDQSPVPVPSTTNVTQTSEWLLQSQSISGGTCYQSFYKQPGIAGMILPGGLHCLMGANNYVAITGAASPFPIAGLAGTQGGAISVTGGASSTSGNAGGAASLAGGAGGATGAGGAASIAGAAGGATSGTGGAASVTAGAGTAGNAAGGVASLTGGAGQGTGAGGAANHTGGASGAGATGNGGASSVTGGAAASVNGTGGAASLVGGLGTGTGAGGAVAVTGGAGGSTGAGGAVAIAAGASTGANGANASLSAGAGNGGTASGGNVNLVPGAAVSTGAPGQLQVNGDGGLICATYYFTGSPAATNQVFFLAPRPMLVVEISEVHSTAAGGTSTLGVYHDTTTAAPATGTDILSADFNLNATANTVQAGSLSATVATKALATGDRLAVKFVNAIQSSAGVVVTACMSPQ